MKKESLCQHHKQQILHSETTAFNYWQMMMHQGVHDYASCQPNLSEKYFTSAFEIALLRYSSKEREIFGAKHLMKPAEFLIRIQVEKEGFEQALIILSTLSSLSDSEDIRKERDLWIFLSEQYQYVTDARTKNNEHSKIPPQLMPYYEQKQAVH